MAEIDIQRELEMLEADLKRLEAEYNMFFAGQLPRPPWETRRLVESTLRRFDRGFIQTYSDRFRFNTLQARFATFVDLWDRGLRAREEGRPGPFVNRARPGTDSAVRILHVTTFKDPRHEMDKVHDLYDRLMDARREIGEDAVPFHKFVDLLGEQVKCLRGAGSPEVAFRVSIARGKVNLTARALKGIRKGEG